MTCTERMGEIVECARRGMGPGRDLEAHLEGCARCAQRWDSERALTDQFAAMRMQAAALSAPAPRHDRSRQVLMRRFATFDFARRHRKAVARSWGLSLAAAAALLLAVFVDEIVARRSPPAPARAAESAPDSVEFSGDATELSSDDFIAVPYTPPLAQGELVRVVHADLAPQALVSLGIDVAADRTDEVAADVVVGEDGIPRAVRLTDASQN